MWVRWRESHQNVADGLCPVVHRGVANSDRWPSTLSASSVRKRRDRPQRRWCRQSEHHIRTHPEHHIRTHLGHHSRAHPEHHSCTHSGHCRAERCGSRLAGHAICLPPIAPIPPIPPSPSHPSQSLPVSPSPSHLSMKEMPFLALFLEKAQINLAFRSLNRNFAT